MIVTFQYRIRINFANLLIYYEIKDLHFIFDTVHYTSNLATAKNNIYCGVMKQADMPPCLGGGEHGINQCYEMAERLTAPWRFESFPYS